MRICQNLIEYLSDKLVVNTPTVLAGDFNYRGIDWEANLAVSSLGQDQFLEFVSSVGMSQLVTFNTRNQSILDLVFVNEPNLIQCVQIGPTVTNCDHLPVVSYLPLTKTLNKSIKIRKYRSANYRPIIEELEIVNWEDLFASAKNVNEMWDLFLSILVPIVDNHIPQCTISNLHKTKLSKRVKILCKKAWKLHKRYKAVGTEVSYLRYLEASRLAQRERRSEIYEREKKVLDSGNVNLFWKYVRDKLIYKSSIPCIYSADREILTDNFSKANRFNEFFCSVFQQDDGIDRVWNIPQPTTLLERVRFEPEKTKLLPDQMAFHLSC